MSSPHTGKRTRGHKLKVLASGLSAAATELAANVLVILQGGTQLLRQGEENVFLCADEDGHGKRDVADFVQIGFFFYLHALIAFRWWWP